MKFGKNSQAECWGYDLDLIIGWLESMIDDEAELKPTKDRQKKLDKAYTALQLLYDISE